MTTQEFLENINKTLAQCEITIMSKNKDYAGDGDPFRNFNSSEFVGVPIPRAILVRMMDKMARISNLLDKEATVKEESIEDTLLDLIGYAAILKAYLYEQRKTTIGNEKTLEGRIVRTDRGFVELGGVDVNEGGCIESEECT